MRRDSVRERPKTISCRRLMGRASRATHLDVSAYGNRRRGRLTRRGWTPVSKVPPWSHWAPRSQTMFVWRCAGARSSSDLSEGVWVFSRTFWRYHRLCGQCRGVAARRGIVSRCARRLWSRSGIRYSRGVILHVEMQTTTLQGAKCLTRSCWICQSMRI